MDYNAEDMLQYMNLIKEAKASQVWVDIAGRYFSDNDRWKLSLILDNSHRALTRKTESSDKVVSISIDEKPNSYFHHKSMMYAIADWFINFPFRNVVGIQPVATPAALAFQVGSEPVVVSALTESSNDVKSAFINTIAQAIIRISGEPVAAVSISEVDNYVKYIPIPENSKLVAIIHGIVDQKPDDGFNVVHTNGASFLENGINHIYVIGLPSNEEIYCFMPNSDFSAGLVFCPYLIGLKAVSVINKPSETEVKYMSRGSVAAFPNARKFYHRIKII